MAALNLAARAVAPPDGRSRRGRLLLEGGATTTFHVACYDAARTEIGVAIMPAGQERLESWCARHDVREALVGGFFRRPDGLPLGEVRTHGVVRDHVAVRGALARPARVRARAGRRSADRSPGRAPRRPAGRRAAGRAAARRGRPGGVRPRGRRGGVPRRVAPVRHRHHRGPPSARRARAVREPRSRRGGRRALPRRRRPDAARARAPDGRHGVRAGDQPRRRRLDVARLRRLPAQRPRRDFEQIEPGGRPLSTALVFRPLR